MAMANNLTGDATQDGPKLQQLQSGFEGAIQKNMGLQSLVMSFVLFVSIIDIYTYTNLSLGHWWP